MSIINIVNRLQVRQKKNPAPSRPSGNKSSRIVQPYNILCQSYNQPRSHSVSGSVFKFATCVNFEPTARQKCLISTGWFMWSRKWLKME